MTKRIFAVLAIVLSSGLLASPLVASANCVDQLPQDVHIGDLVKVSGRSTIFYIADNGLRYNFPNAAVYKSWYGNDFSKVKLISNEQLMYRPQGGYVMFRPGTALVKFKTSRDVYVVVKNNELRRLASPTVARQLFGANWTRKIETLPANFGGAMKMGLDIVTTSDYESTTQTKPVQLTLYPPMNMVVMR